MQLVGAIFEYIGTFRNTNTGNSFFLVRNKECMVKTEHSLKCILNDKNNVTKKTLKEFGNFFVSVLAIIII